MLLALFTAAALMAAAPSATPTANPAAAPANAPAPAAKNASAATTVSPLELKGERAAEADRKRIVCRREIVLGSLFPKETCASKGELAERQRIDQATTRDAQAQRPFKIDGTVITDR